MRARCGDPNEGSTPVVDPFDMPQCFEGVPSLAAAAPGVTDAPKEKVSPPSATVGAKLSSSSSSSSQPKNRSIMHTALSYTLLLGLGAQGRTKTRKASART